jgi:hypothetical protein
MRDWCTRRLRRREEGKKKKKKKGEKRDRTMLLQGLSKTV